MRQVLMRSDLTRQAPRSSRGCLPSSPTHHPCTLPTNTTLVFFSRAGRDRRDDRERDYDRRDDDRNRR